MMAAEPLRSATAIGVAEDTSLALPSDNNLSSGQQRVLSQVHTIKRSKSRHGKNGTQSPSPTGVTPTTSTTYNEFGAFKFSPSKVNGTFSRTTSTMSSGYDKAMHSQRSRSVSTRSTRRHVSNSGTWEQQIVTPQKANGLKPSRSDPALAPAFSAPPPASMKVKGQMAQSQNSVRGTRQSSRSMIDGQTRVVRPPSLPSNIEGKMGTIKISKVPLALNSGVNTSNLTLKEAVEFLSHPEVNYQQFGATFIQHTTFNEENAKAEVLQLGGIPALVTLLRSPNPGVSLAAAGALRNLVFKDQNNKLEVQHCSGIAKALQLLQETESTETQKQVTGLLWNLSSADVLKKELITTAMPVLTKQVLMPFNSWSDSSTTSHIDPSVFYFATGCLRNLSSCLINERQAMRNCDGLIDSLMSYVQSCVAEENPDDMSVENCACILQNLTYQLEQECPESFSSYYPAKGSQAESRKSPTVGCFSPRSSRVQKEFSFDESQAFPENGTPLGVKWLSHPKAMDVYLALLGSSKKDTTLEASLSALQNMTASRKQGSTAVSQILLQKLKSLFLLPSLLNSPNQTLQKTTLSLLDSMSRPSSSQASMAKLVLPELTGLLTSNSQQMGNCDEATASICNTVRRLIAADNEVSKKAISSELVYSLVELSEKNKLLPKSSKAASVLLYNLWGEKNLQSIVKKLGMDKSLFHNEKTTSAHKSLQTGN